MKQLLFQFIKLLFYTLFGAFLFLYIYDYLNDYLLSISKIFIFSLFFAFFISLILLSVHIFFVQKYFYNEIMPDNFGANQKITIISKINFIDFKNILVLKKQLKYYKMEIKENYIKLLTPISWKSFGEIIIIKMISSSEKRNEYLVSSSPLIKTTVVDYGKNMSNILKIEKLLNDY